MTYKDLARTGDSLIDNVKNIFYSITDLKTITETDLDSLDIRVNKFKHQIRSSHYFTKQ